MEIKQIPLQDIDPNHIVNCRKDLNIDALVESIKVSGLQTPLGVVELDNQKFGLVYGFRRFAALKQLQFNNVTCRLVENKTSSDLYIMNLQENVSRQNLNPMEEAEAIQRIIESGRDIDDFRQALGWSKTIVTQRLGLLELSDTIKEALQGDQISIRQAKVIDGADDNHHEILLGLAQEGATIQSLKNEIEQLKTVSSLVSQDDQALELTSEDEELTAPEDDVQELNDSLDDKKALQEADSNLVKATLLDCGAKAIKDDRAYFAFQVAINCVDFAKIPQAQLSALVNAVTTLGGEQGLDSWGESHHR